jgi:hypothetical protein
MDIGSAFSFVFDDQDWIKKIAVGGGILLAGIILTPILVGLALFLPISGYMLETLKNVRDGHPTPLPEWTDFGALFSKGLMVAVIYLVYNLPSLILVCASAGVNIFASNPDVDPDLAATLAIVGGCISCVQFLVSLAGNILIPGALIRYARAESLGSAFQVMEIINFIKNNIGDYVIVFLLTIVAGMVGGLGFILCIIGVFFTAFWANLVTANLYGQLARKAGA